MKTVSCSRRGGVHGRSTRWICVLRESNMIAIRLESRGVRGHYSEVSVSVNLILTCYFGRVHVQFWL